MYIRAELGALRGDDSPQRLAQSELFAQLAEWRASPAAAPVLRDLETFGCGGDLEECKALETLLHTGGTEARQLVDSFVAATLAGLRRAPLGHVPLRHRSDGAVSTILLARSGLATLSLTALDGVVFHGAEPVTVSFSSHHSWEAILAGSAVAELVAAPRAEGSPLARRSVLLEPDTFLERDARQHALVFQRVAGCLVTLRLQRREPAPEPVREHAVADGRLVHQAAADPGDSRRELMLALLGRMGRSDAAPLMAAMATAPGSAGLRWQALRECLALDTAQGFAALGGVALSSEDPLAPAAGALRAQLIETYPVLAQIEPQACLV